MSVARRLLVSFAVSILAKYDARSCLFWASANCTMDDSAAGSLNTPYQTQNKCDKSDNKNKQHSKSYEMHNSSFQREKSYTKQKMLLIRWT